MKLNKNVVKFSAAVAGAVALGTVAVATNASADTIYTVKSGDTLSQISYNYSNDLSLVDTMVQKNNIADKNLIYVGQKLIIKDDGEVRPATQTEVETTPAASSSATSSSAATSTSATSASAAGSEAAAKAWIANRESGGSYTATNGQYIGKYQLSSSYLNGDYSAANQEKVADSYVASQYGSWSAAKQYWLSNGWY